MELVTLDQLLLKWALLALFIERAVAQIKAIVRTDLFGEDGPARPWPLISFIASGVAVFGWDLFVISALVGHPPNSATGLMRGLDWFISTLTVAGGSAGVIDLIKGVGSVRKQAKAA
jgi:hypothetical protein